MLVSSCSQALDHERSISSSPKLPLIYATKFAYGARVSLMIASRNAGGNGFFVMLLACYAFVTKTFLYLLRRIVCRAVSGAGIHHSLKSPACLCVSITLPAAS